MDHGVLGGAVLKLARPLTCCAGAVIAIALFALFTWMLIERAQRDVRDGAEASLSALVKAMEASFGDKRRLLLESAQSFAQRPETIAAVRLLLDEARASSQRPSSEGQRQIQQVIQPLLRPAMYQGFLLIGPGDIDLLSDPGSERRSPSLLRSQSSLLERAWVGETLLSAPQLSDIPLPDPYGRGYDHMPTMLSIAPIKDSSGEVMALLVIRVDPWLTFFPVVASARAGTSGKSYAFDRAGHLLSGTRFAGSLWDSGQKSADSPALRKLVLQRPDNAGFIRPVAEALGGRNGVDVQGYSDHTGEHVIGAWRWIDDLSLGVATEVDKKEIYADFMLLRTTVYGVTAIAAMLLSIIGYLNLRQKKKLRRQVERQTTALHAEKMRLEAFFRHAPNGLILLDDSYRITLLNARALEIFSRREEELLGGTIDLLLVDSLPPPAAMPRGEPHECTGRRGDGTRVPLNLSITEISSPTCAAYLARFCDLTEEKRLDRVIRDEKRRREKAEHRERQLLDAVGEGILGVGQQGHIRFINPMGARLLGYSTEDLLGRHLGEGVVPLCDPGSPLLDFDFATDKTQETLLQRSDGTWFEAEYVKTPLLDGNVAYGWAVVFSDISARKRAEQSLRLAEHVFSHMTEGLVVADAQGRVLRVNRALCDIVGYSEYEIVGQRCPPYRSGVHTAAFYEQLWDTLIRDGCWEGEVWNRRKNGDVFPTVQTIVAVKDSNSKTSHFISVTRDVTEQRRVEERVQRLAYFDNLTDLPNRELFHDRLRHALQRAQRHAGIVALLFLDLDHFKAVNDGLGHLVGDRLLKSAAKRLQGLIREEDTIARYGGDEFTVLLESVKDKASIQNVAEKIIDAISQPFEIHEHQLHIGTSVGISCYPNDGIEVETLIKNADTAMYKAKAGGRNNYRFFSQDLAVVSGDHVELSGELRCALGNDEFVLYYQPQYSGDGRLVAVEALIRWQDPDRGLISPERFIPLANETDLILAIDEWVLRTACGQMQRWRVQGAPDIKIAVNLSSRHVMCGDIVNTVARVLQESGLPTRSLELEITEHFVTENLDRAIEVLTQLRSLGVSVAIDVFGTGYSLLASLRRLPVDSLKIDSDFFPEASNESNGRAIARAVVTMAHQLNINVVAERITTIKQKDLFLREGCDAFQGFLFAQPLPAESIEQLWKHSAEVAIVH